MHSEDPFLLRRFVEAQDSGGTYERAVAELRRGRKTSHWMWFVFPQVRGLGLSATSVRYAIGSLDEAAAYLGHPVLGPRLLECASIVAASDARSADALLGGIDAQKLQSSMTLFERASPGTAVFGTVLERYFGGARDDQTIARLPASHPDD
jgi:uncharacterized protein (DUF1810 family)